MASDRQPSVGHEAGLDELAGIGKNRRFDEFVKVQSAAIHCSAMATMRGAPNA